MMSHTCITCPLSFLGWVHVISFSQQSGLPSPLLGQLGSLSSPLSSYLVEGACYVIQLLDLLPSSVHHSAPISVLLPVGQEREFISHGHLPVHLNVHLF